MEAPLRRRQPGEDAGRQAGGISALETVARDLRHGLRRLTRDWLFTTAAVLILGLAIGANTAMFSLVNAVLFRREAVANPDRLVNIYQDDPAGRPLVVTSYAAYLEMASATDLFASTMAATIPIPVRYLHEGAVRGGVAEYATATYLDVLAASIGLYAVVAFAVTRRTREIGIRIALGARSRQVVWSIARGMTALLAIGTGIGLMLALLATLAMDRASGNIGIGNISALGYHPRIDPLALLAIALVTAVVGVAAALVPGRRAARMEPLAALRHD